MSIDSTELTPGAAVVLLAIREQRPDQSHELIVEGFRVGWTSALVRVLRHLSLVTPRGTKPILLTEAGIAALPMAQELAAQWKPTERKPSASSVNTLVHDGFSDFAQHWLQRPWKQTFCRPHQQVRGISPAA